MSKIKFVLPMLAFVLAIGMSFAFTANEDVVMDDQAVLINGVAYRADTNCEGISHNCEIQLTDENGTPLEGEVYQVFGLDSDGQYTIPLKSDSDEPTEVVKTTLQPVN